MLRDIGLNTRDARKHRCTLIRVRQLRHVVTGAQQLVMFYVTLFEMRRVATSAMPHAQRVERGATQRELRELSYEI